MSVVNLLFILTSFYGAPLFTFRNGIGALPLALAGRLDVRLGTRVEEIAERPQEVVVSLRDGDGSRTEAFEYCVVALTAPQLAAVFPQLPAGARAAIANLHYSSILAVHLALDHAPDSRSLAVMFDEASQPDLCSIFLDHNKSRIQAPGGSGLVTVFWDHRRAEHLWHTDDEAVVDLTVKAASTALPEIDDEVRFGRVTRREPGILAAKPGSYRSIAVLNQARAESKRVVPAGDFLGGADTNSALCSGMWAAQRIQALAGGTASAVTR